MSLLYHLLMEMLMQKSPWGDQVIYRYPDDPDGTSHHINLHGGYKVTASQCIHTVTCYGYVFKEPEEPGNIDKVKVRLSIVSSFVLCFGIYSIVGKHL